MTTTQASITATTTPDGRDGYRIECSCSTHPEGMSAAIVAFPITAKTVHGNVLMAHHPARPIQQSNARKGIWKA
jgi:hypothetical protein